RQIIACTFSSLKFENRASDGSILMRAFIGGTQNRDILGYSDDRIEGIVCNELKVILGISAKPLFMKIFRYPKAMPQYHVGHLERINNLEASLSKLPGLTLTGNGYRGIGIPDCINQAQKTAEKIANMMKN
ncbi:MAG: protoporphyrinogen oxidase, partial [Chlamydiota bacterium]|nr:protoporphyrinogen oxidase [Chlamydiota bacterium]